MEIKKKKIMKTKLVNIYDLIFFISLIKYKIYFINE